MKLNKTLLLITLVFTLTACGKTNTPADTSTPPSTTPQTEEATTTERIVEQTPAASQTLPGFSYDIPAGWQDAGDTIASSDVSNELITYGRFFQYLAPEYLKVVEDLQKDTTLSQEDKNAKYLEEVYPNVKPVAGFYALNRKLFKGDPKVEEVAPGFSEIALLQEDDDHYYLIAKGTVNLDGLSESSTAQYQAVTDGVADLQNSLKIHPDSIQTHAKTKLTQGNSFVLDTTSFDGSPFTSDAFADSKITLINFWATWCGYCVEELPDLGKIAKEYDSKNLQVIGILTDGETGNTPIIEKAQKMLTDAGASYTNLLMSESLTKNYGMQLTSMPTTLFVDKDGKLLGEPILGAMNYDKFKEITDKLLSEIDNPQP